MSTEQDAQEQTPSAADGTGPTENRRAVATLGERLAQLAEQMVARRLPDFPWMQPLLPVVKRVMALPAPAETRFQRTEAAFGPAMPGTRQSGVDEWDWAAGRQRAAFSSASRPLAPDLQSRLRTNVGPGVEAIRIHDDPDADAVARAHHADAVTMAQHVFFRQDRFRPNEPQGFALLAHETTHVLQSLRPGADWQRATGGGVAAEEVEASARERAALSQYTAWPLAERPQDRSPKRSAATPFASGPWLNTVPAEGRSAAGHAPPQVGPAASPTLRPMTAPVDREIGDPVSSTPALDVEQLKRTIYQDLMRQLRTDFERGG